MKAIDVDLLKEFLDDKVRLYNRPDFISLDPISIPHSFSKKEDIEISGFLAATIAWGQRPVILRNARLLMQLMDDAPHDFIMGFNKADLKRFNKFKHRTFNHVDCISFLHHLSDVYRNKGGIERIFLEGIKKDQTDLLQSITTWRKIFCSGSHSKRSEKHFSDPSRGSAAKRLNMFLRWMIRKDKAGVDFGIWKSISPALLSCPLDVHSGRVARKLGLLKRTQDDWKAVAELTQSLRKLDPNDPVKYDFALFGLGVSEKF